MNNYIQRAECWTNVAISLKFAKYPNIAFILSKVCQSLSIRFDLSRIRPLVYTIRPLPWFSMAFFLSSKSPWISRNVYFHRGNVPAFSISISRPLGPTPNLWIGRREFVANMACWIRNIQQCPTTRKNRWKLETGKRIYFFFLYFFFFFF